MPVINRNVLIGGGVFAALVLAIVLFVWPGVIVDPFGDGDNASATYNGDGQTVTATPVSEVSGATVPDPFAQNSGGDCQPGDKIGTWSEIQGAGPQRIEVGGHGGQHLDFYPAPGVKSVSYVVSTIANPDGTPSLAFGFGSIWEWNPPGCEYDYVADATAYARARLDSGHSGLVVDLRSSPPQVVANVANMSQDAINSLLEQHSAAMQRDGKQFQFTTQKCADEVREDHQPVVGQAWTPNGGWRVINFWTNQPGLDQKERKLLLSPSDNVGLLGGGASWSWPAGCEQAARDAFANNGLSPVTLDQLRAEGLAK